MREESYTMVSRTCSIRQYVMLYALLLTVASLAVIVQGASDEPYYRFHPSDCLVQVGAGVALLALWAQFSLAIVVATATSRLPRRFLFILLWAAVVCFYLFLSPTGYVSDMVEHGWKFQ